MSSTSDMNDSDVRDAATLCLPADLGIERLASLREQLAAVPADAPLTLDARQVSRVHSAALQLLAAFCRDRHAAGLSTVWSASSDVWREAARRLGLSLTLQLEEH